MSKSTQAEKGLSPGAQELADRFSEQYALLSPDERKAREKEIFLGGRYAYQAAYQAYWTIARLYGWPGMDWSMSGVTFVLNSQIPNTIGILRPAEETSLLSESILGYSLGVLMPIAACIGIFLALRIPEANITYLRIECCIALPMLIAGLCSFGLSGALSSILAKTMFKH